MKYFKLFCQLMEIIQIQIHRCEHLTLVWCSGLWDGFSFFIKRKRYEWPHTVHPLQHIHITYSMFGSTGPGADKSVVIVSYVYLYSVVLLLSVSAPAVHTQSCNTVAKIQALSSTIQALTFPHILPSVLREPIFSFSYSHLQIGGTQ